MFNTQEDKQRLLSHFSSIASKDHFRKYYGAYCMPIFAQGYFAVTAAAGHAPYAFSFGLFFQNFTRDKEFNWNWSVEEMENLRHAFFAALKRDASFGDAFYNAYMDDFRYFDRDAKAEEKIAFTELSNRELVDRVLALIEAAGRQGHGYAVDCFLGRAEDTWFEDRVAAYAGQHFSDADMAALREPTHRTFVNEAFLRMVEIAILRKDGKHIEKKLDDLARDFYWIENNYLRGTPKTAEDFLREIDDIHDPRAIHITEQKRIDDLKEKKDIIISRVSSPQMLHTFIRFLDNAAHIQDCRKQVVLRLNYFLFFYLDELARRIGFDPELIRYIMFFELKDLLRDPDAFRSLAAERREGCLALIDRQGCALLLRKDLEGIDLAHFFQDYHMLQEAKGTPASRGRAAGTVRVVLGSDQFDSFERGDILVTNQTTPDFLPLMKKAAAIVAEQGGMTSHAAVISRELNIPCIVGVKNAMEIFASGESVIVDAENGSIKKQISKL
ncbi:MAG: hypothetical protein A3G08_02845 [Candidatus Magasanikbacteria bacterium RIFCSPLOWO2_12_FULL_47_9b]|nr:MAG: hypothetical protein A3G08_02845 [Candidatus Magasanikbacteria bacterium RIFCSPLOWO2_12_FULL_47_9b]